MITQTRLKAGAGAATMVFILAILSHFLKGIPFIAASSVISGIYVTYVTGKSTTDVKEIKNGSVEQ